MRSSLLELIAPSVCPACDVPRRPGTPRLCPTCQAALHPLRELAGVRTALAYEGTGARLVQRFKFEARTDALAVLLEPLVERAAELRVDGIIAIPRHRQRVRELGADPVHDLARALAARMGWPLWGRLLRRTRPTPPQTGLTPAARRVNVAGSFEARPGALRGLRILLLDDVVTTGATLGSASHQLRHRGAARRVIPLALAGTPAHPLALSGGSLPAL